MDGSRECRELSRGEKPAVTWQVVERMEEMPTLNDKHIQRIFEYFRKLHWSDADIAQFIDYLTK